LLDYFGIKEENTNWIIPFLKSFSLDLKNAAILVSDFSVLFISKINES
jgi:hypothetical protein